MDQLKIGKFIAERRKKAGFTQTQLAEKLGITDKAISKWERGISMPDSSIMLLLCELLEINVNELLSGEVLTVDNYNKETEAKLIEMIKEKERKDRQLLALEWVIGILSVAILLIPVIIASYIPMEEWQRVVTVLSGFIPCLVGITFAIKIEQMAGYYECKHCKHRYVPTLGAVIFAPHMGRTRKMKCPECGEKSWQRKVITKE